jgi:hypothetical protein
MKIALLLVFLATSANGSSLKSELLRFIHLISGSNAVNGISTWQDQSSMTMRLFAFSTSIHIADHRTPFPTIQGLPWDYQDIWHQLHRVGDLDTPEEMAASLNHQLHRFHLFVAQHSSTAQHQHIRLHIKQTLHYLTASWLKVERALEVNLEPWVNRLWDLRFELVGDLASSWRTGEAVVYEQLLPQEIRHTSSQSLMRRVCRVMASVLHLKRSQVSLLGPWPLPTPSSNQDEGFIQHIQHSLATISLGFALADRAPGTPLFEHHSNLLDTSSGWYSFTVPDLHAHVFDNWTMYRLWMDQDPVHTHVRLKVGQFPSMLEEDDDPERIHVRFISGNATVMAKVVTKLTIAVSPGIALPCLFGIHDDTQSFVFRWRHVICIRTGMTTPVHVCANPGCNHVANKTCSRCKSVRYCSVGCQTAHWRQAHRGTACIRFERMTRHRVSVSVGQEDSRQRQVCSVVTPEGEAGFGYCDMYPETGCDRFVMPYWQSLL